MSMYTQAEKDFLISELEGRRRHWQRNADMYRTDLEINPHNLEYTEIHISNLKSGLKHCEDKINAVDKLLTKLTIE
jgi:hypothetical protein